MEFRPPQLEERCICVTNSAILGAMISSYFSKPDKYFAIFRFPEIEQTAEIGRIEGILASGARVLINNCFARLRPARVILAGLNSKQESYFDFIPRGVALTIHDAHEISRTLQFLNVEFAGVGHSTEPDLPLALLAAKRSNNRLEYDSNAAPIQGQNGIKNAGLIVVEKTGKITDIIAANYAQAVNADLAFVRPFEHRESSRINRLLNEWGLARSKDAYAELCQEVQSRLGHLELSEYQYLTFFTQGLPYGLVLRNAIPISHVMSGVRPDVFLFENIFAERCQQPFGSALVFSPRAFTAEETDDVIKLLTEANYSIKQLIGTDATAVNFEDYVSHYPYDLLHICSHGGEVGEGYHVVQEFRDRNNAKHVVEYDEVVVFGPAEGEKIRVEAKAIMRSLDGFAWMSPELRELGLPSYVYQDMVSLLSFAKEGVKRTKLAVPIVDSCHVLCYDNIHQGLFHAIASHNFPIVFNNTCSSWSDIGACFVGAGCRGYIGTLWPVGNDTATNAARHFYRRATSKTFLNAFGDMLAEIDDPADRDVYFFWGLHFARLPEIPISLNDRIVQELLRGFTAWVDKLREPDLSPSVRRNSFRALRTVVRFLAAEPRGKEAIEAAYRQNAKLFDSVAKEVEVEDGKEEIINRSVVTLERPDRR